MKSRQIPDLFYDAEELVILISSLGSAITFPHLLHLDTCKGSYIGIKTLTFGSEEECSTKTLFTWTLSH